MTFFDLIIRWVESSDFGPKSDDMGHRILKSDFIPSDFAKSDCISRPILFADRKIKIRSSESDRIINGLGLLMQSDFAKSDRIKFDLRIQWPRSSDFGPKSDDSTHRIIKSKNGIGL